MRLQIFLRARFCCTKFLTAAFLAARYSAFWLIDNEILGPGYDRGFGRYILFDILLLYHKCVFLVFCSYLLFRAYFFAPAQIYPAGARYFYTGRLHLRLFWRRYRPPKRGVFAGFYRIFSRDLHLRFGRNFCAEQLFDDPLRDHLYA